ncbi:MAG: hypothetical protein ACRCTY_03785 [Candidatus Adiutrix sp.]
MMGLKNLINKSAQSQIDFLYQENTFKWAAETKFLEINQQKFKDASQRWQNNEISRLTQIQKTDNPILILLAESTLIENEYSQMLKRAAIDVHINETAISSLKSAAEKIGFVEEAVRTLILHPKCYQTIMIIIPDHGGVTPCGAPKKDRITNFCNSHLTRLNNRNKYTGGTLSDSKYIEIRKQNISQFQKQYYQIREIAAKEGTTPYETLIKRR